MKQAIVVRVDLGMSTGKLAAVRAVAAVDRCGDWQGVLHTGPVETRHILSIAKAPDGRWSAKLFSIDQTHDWG
jgi:hypothetical protein